MTSREAVPDAQGQLALLIGGKVGKRAGSAARLCRRGRSFKLLACRCPTLHSDQTLPLGPKPRAASALSLRIQSKTSRTASRLLSTDGLAAASVIQIPARHSQWAACNLITVLPSAPITAQDAWRNCPSTKYIPDWAYRASRRLIRVATTSGDAHTQIRNTVGRRGSPTQRPRFSSTM
ncbi:hypothetical protein CERZMDRAFT_92304 [Cercospora zeae-maydis SCOH1-5]|uniref:Uncharacterized protein n=1 Tax=Cercospora zeae-maydis SCOH1-5 TaxID=717836 RepID=A0A6A6FVZ3_9PEZI|nr:hypothetical protein CERZMDRAFT_92304 [Cercospora zeae-maydis SCOH1-5]